MIEDEDEDQHEDEQKSKRKGLFGCGLIAGLQDGTEWAQSQPSLCSGNKCRLSVLFRVASEICAGRLVEASRVPTCEPEHSPPAP